MLYAVEAAIAAEQGYDLCIMIGDEALAYTGTQFDEDEEPRFVLITQRDLEWIPERWQERIRTQLRASPEGVLVPLRVWLYGDLRSGFKYEARRNRDFISVGYDHRPRTSMFRTTAAAPSATSGPADPK